MNFQDIIDFNLGIIGKIFLFSLAAGGQKGVEKLLQNMQDEIRRNMVLMGCKTLKEIDISKIIYRKQNEISKKS